MSPGTPRKNGVVGWGFDTLYLRVRFMMQHTVKHENLKTVIWPKLAAIATKLENILVNPNKEKCAHEKLYGKIPYYAKYLSTFGEMVVVQSIATME